MFDFFVSAAQAYNQIGMFFGAVICLAIGGALLGNSLYWQVHAVRASGTIIGVLSENGVYVPVYRYLSPGGQAHEARSDTGSSSVRGKETGRVIPLLISAHNPSEAREAGDHLLDIIGLAFLIPGVWLGYTALTAYPITRMSWIMGLAFLVYIGERLHGIMRPKGQHVSIEEWKKQHNFGEASAVDLARVKPIESLATAPAAAQTQWRNTKSAGPLLGLFAVVLIALATYQSIRVLRFERSGVRASGQVVRMVEQSSSGSSGGYVYYPVVRFRTADNATIEFKDNFGSNPPARRPGDKATVLYLPADPAQAMIDRGFLNWAIPALLLLAAGIVVWLAAKFRSARSAAMAPASAG
jgi:uncharacterized protein DUF3592